MSYFTPFRGNISTLSDKAINKQSVQNVHAAVNQNGLHCLKTATEFVYKNTTKEFKEND